MLQAGYGVSFVFGNSKIYNILHNLSMQKTQYFVNFANRKRERRTVNWDYVKAACKECGIYEKME